MSGILDIISRQVNEETLRKLSRQIGAEPSETQRAVTVAMPVLIGGLARETEHSGAGALAQALDRDHDGSFLDSLGSLLDQSAGGHSVTDADQPVPGGMSVDRRTADGDGILRHVLGDRRSAVELGISRASGLDVKKVSRLLPLLAPILMSALGRLKRQQHLDADGVAATLDQERRQLEGEASDGTGSLLHLLDRDQDGEVADDVARLGASMGTSLLGNIFRKASS